MDARERWQALHARLRAARTSLESGDREAALAEVDAALALDPNFLAAHSLRDRILSPTPDLEPAEPAAPADAAAAPFDSPPAGVPLVSTEGYARFEQRARRRRTDRKLDAARNALRRGRLHAAASALDEIIELDPNLPDLAALTAEFDDLRRLQARSQKGRWLVAVAAFAAVALGATWLQDASWLRSQVLPVADAIVAPAAPAPLEPVPSPTAADPSVTMPTVTGDQGQPASSPGQPAIEVPRAEPPPVDPSRAEPLRAEPSRVEPRPAAPPPAEPRRAEPPRVTPSPFSPALHSTPAAVGDEPSPQASLVAPAVTAPTALALVIPPEPPRAEPRAAAPDDQALIQAALQDYRRAYDGLDARSAARVWPAVNETALARAFDGLASQSLTFEACNVRLEGEVASASCRGSARYVPKIGSREPRIEPRVWTFELRRAGAGWFIESARVEQ